MHDKSESLVLGHIADLIPSLSFVRRSINVASHVLVENHLEIKGERERERERYGSRNREIRWMMISKESERREGSWRKGVGVGVGVGVPTVESAK